MIEYLVVVMLTFADGSVASYNDGPPWVTVASYEACLAEIKKETEELKVIYKDATDPKPSTFIQGCVQVK